jgi:transposase
VTHRLNLIRETTRPIEGAKRVIVIGIDAHKRTHTLVAVDAGGGKLGEKAVEATSAGHADALHWAASQFGRDLLWGVEDNRSVTGLLEQDLLAAKMPVVRVPPTLMARSRASARTWGKSDPIDATAVARAILREPDLPIVQHDPASWELKLLVDRREDLVLQRVGVLNRSGRDSIRSTPRTGSRRICSAPIPEKHSMNIWPRSRV